MLDAPNEEIKEHLENNLIWKQRRTLIFLKYIHSNALERPDHVVYNVNLVNLWRESITPSLGFHHLDINIRRCFSNIR